MGLRVLLIILASWVPIEATASSGFRPFPHFSLSRYVTGETYILDIRLHHLRPEQVQVEVKPPWLIIRTDHRQAEQQASGFPEGWRFVRRYRAAQQMRRVTLPPDADADALRREDRASYIRIQVPRRR